MWRRFLKFAIHLLPDSYVQKRYVKAGADFGEMVIDLYMGKCVGFDEGFERWAFWEREHARRGYHTAEIDDFCDYAEFAADHSMIGRKRRSDELEVLYAEHSRQFFIEGFHSTRFLEEAISRKVVQGQYERPSNGDSEDSYKSVLERE